MAVLVMAVLVTAIHVFLRDKKDVDGRNKPALGLDPGGGDGLSPGHAQAKALP